MNHSRKKVSLHLHIFNGSAKCVCYNALLNVLFAQTEIGQFHVSLCVQQNIFRFQVSVNDAERMQMLQGQYYFAQIKTEKWKRIKIGETNNKKIVYFYIWRLYHVVSSRKIPSRSKCMNSSPPLKYSRIKYNLPSVWKAYTNSTMNGCWKGKEIIINILFFKMAIANFT